MPRAVSNRLLVCAIALLSTLSGHDASARELSETWTNVRALGMGNAYTALVDDVDSLFYNPAGLARNSAFSWEVFDPRVGLNGADAIQSAQELASAGDNVSEVIESLYGKKLWAGGGMKTGILIPNFAMAGFVSANAAVNVQNPAATTMNLNYFLDYGVALGGGFSFIPNFMQVGLAVKRINRTGTTLPVGPSTLATLDPADLQAELKRRGTGYALDFGTVISVPGPVSPSLSFVYKNLGGTSFSHEEGAGAPPYIEPEMIIGAALDIDAGLVSVTPVLDYKYANRADIQLGKKVHLGVEIDLPLLELRAGLHQGYYSAGVGVNMGILRVDAATYGVELGEFPGQHEDRRYVAQVSFELGFDPGQFGFGGGSGAGKDGKPGERRRLKQRR